MRLRRGPLTALILGLLALGEGSAGAATRVVDDDGRQCVTPFTSIQAAIDASGPGDTIRVCRGTYARSSPSPPGRTACGLYAVEHPSARASSRATTARRGTTGRPGSSRSRLGA